ncbi:DUF3299 domain-containing protein [Halopseudomonas aestusnigri]|jgi:hypothetical protein|uniref:DUF3299 domain-containing protein n=1 Tax=Halopseudomonas aestusnigri TaxID=857252 RepID=UPI000C4D8F14|nr:hypothetical protein [Pseudomonadales bacterium]GMQ55233.1 DUF3299 domain-containing protein [Halopseudomonas aestusnigri]
MRLTHLFALTLSLLILPAEAARELSWDDLVPAGTGHLYGMPPAQHNGLQSEDQAPANPLTQSMANAPTVAELDGQEVKLPGYVVPLNVDPNQRVTEFLLVPYFGACIHVPPPPSNQIVLVHSEIGIALDATWVPYWITGKLRVEQSESELASAGYRLEASAIEEFVY